MKPNQTPEYVASRIPNELERLALRALIVLGSLSAAAIVFGLLVVWRILP